MAECGEHDRGELPPSSTGETPPVPGDKGAAGKTHCEAAAASVLNGDCGIQAAATMVIGSGSGSISVPGSQAGLGEEVTTTGDDTTSSAGMDAKSGIPRRSSIIKPVPGWGSTLRHTIVLTGRHTAIQRASVSGLFPPSRRH
ncbi:hypothetical protein NHX12_001245 [Muraenolepis orangiensis]|uniref:Uncharacterized protein n=1 Tax=Muraenolepis orangiensis TaxID=630683 RepID=A0A9Q0E0I6_9TELE|nr:hypothetical protein NHX12_001245 [Muraenolepis orangiensis]